MPSSSCLALSSSSSFVACCHGLTTLPTSLASSVACCCPSPFCLTSPSAPLTSTANVCSSSCQCSCTWACSPRSSSGSTSTPSTGNGLSISPASPSPANFVNAMITTHSATKTLEVLTICLPEDRGFAACVLPRTQIQINIDLWWKPSTVKDQKVRD